jgi:hypothetical protein
MLAWLADRVGRDLIIGRDLQTARFLARRRYASKHNFEPKVSLTLLIFNNNNALTHLHPCLAFFRRQSLRPFFLVMRIS